MNIGRIRTFFSVNFKLCIIEIYANRMRTFITTLGIFLGIAALLINLAFVRGLDDDLRFNMERIGGLNIITIRSVEPVSKEEKMKFQRSTGISIEESREVVRSVPYVKNIIISKNLGWEQFSAQGKISHGKLIAASQEYLKVYNYSTAIGKSLTLDDMLKRRYVCIIGMRLAVRLFGSTENAVGREILVRNTSFTVAGIIYAENIHNERAMECIFPFSAYAMKFADAQRNMSEVSLILINSSYAKQALRELRNIYHGLHRGAFDIEIEASADKIKEMETATLGIKIIFWSIAVISLLVGGISIMNIMFASIGDRMREIGIRKALGAQRLDIFTQFLIEAVLVCFVGAIPGALLGASIILMPEGFFMYKPRLIFSDYAIGFGFTVLVGIISGLFPAIKAANMQPIEALRY